MSRAFSSGGHGVLALAGGAIVAGLASGRPELVVLAAPTLLFVALGLIFSNEPRLSAQIGVGRTRLIEGQDATATVRVRNDGSAAVELELALVRTSQVMLEPSGPVMVRLAGGHSVDLGYRVRPQRWGAHAVGPLLVRARDPLGMTVWDPSG